MKYTRFICLSALLFGLSILCSCVKKEYDITSGNIDTSLGLGGDSLAFPLGKTDTLFFSKLIGDSGFGDFLKILPEDGSYAFYTDDSISIKVPQLKGDDFSVEGMAGSSSVNVEFASEVDAKSAAKASMTLKAFLADSIPVSIKLKQLPVELVSIDSIQVAPVNVEIKLHFKNLNQWLAEGDVLKTDLWISLPPQMQFSPTSGLSGGKYHLQQEVTTEDISIVLPLRTMDLSRASQEQGQIAILEKIKIAGSLSLTVQDPNALSTGSPILMELDNSYQIDRIFPAVFFGKVNPEIESNRASVVIKGIPEMFKGPEVILDFSRPYLTLKLEGNSEISMESKIQIVPYMGGEPHRELMQEIKLRIPASPGGNMKQNLYWISAQAKDVPAGYTWVQSDLAALLKKIPDSLQMQIGVNTDLSQPHRYNFSTRYQEKILYNLVVPLSFGPNLNLIVLDTLSHMPSILGDILKGGELFILGSVVNTLPLDLNLHLSALDEKGSLIPLEISTQKVASGTPLGGEVVTPLNISIKDRASVLGKTPISSFLIEMKGTTTAEMAGVPVKPTSYVQAILKVKKTGGIILSE